MATLENPRLPEPPAGGSVRLSNISWDRYLALRNENDHRNLRLTFDRGFLEIMSPSKRHERVASLLGRLIEAWTEEQGLTIQACRTTTFLRKDLDRALEPDNCYYIEHEPQVRDRDRLDLKIDPPPDLIVEVDLRSPSLDRLPIYAAMGAPEVWLWRREQIQIHRLLGAEYQPCEASQALPGFPVGEAAELLSRRLESDDNALVRSFRKLISDEPAGGAGQGSA